MPHYSVIEMKGPDARDFLHRLTTTDVRNLGVGETAPGFFLEASGKIRASFQIICQDSETFLLITPRGTDDHWKKALLAVIDQFTFSEKFSLQERQDLKAEESTAPQGAWSIRLGDDFFINVGAEVASAPDEVVGLQRMLSLVPQIDHELTPAANPLELGLRSSIADQKGCYPGQEVIEKIISLGSPARRLCLLKGVEPGPGPVLGSSLFTESGTEAGTVTSVMSTPQGAFALAILKKMHAQAGIALKTPEGLSLQVQKVSQYQESTS